MDNLKKNIIDSAKDRFSKIPIIVQIDKFNVNLGWLEVHYVDAEEHSLNDFILSSLRHVEFWKYEKNDQLEFENDISFGQYKIISAEEANKKLQLLNNMFSVDLANSKRELIPRKLSETNQPKTILIYDECNNTSIVLVSETQYKIIYFGHSE